MAILRIMICFLPLLAGDMSKAADLLDAGPVDADSLTAVSNGRDEFKSRVLLGQIKFYASQQKYFDALSIIDSAPEISTRELNRRLLYLRDDDGSVQTVAEIELAYRMSQRAGNAVNAIVGDRIEQRERNVAAYELAQIYYNKQQYEYASFALQLIRGELFYPFNRDVRYLQAKIAANTQKYSEAVEIFSELKYDDRFKGFATFNLGHVLLASEQEQYGLEQIAVVGGLKTDEPTLLALKDKANLLLGYHQLENAQPEQAKAHLNKVRLSGAFSNKALLGVAWADMALKDYNAAIVPWTELHSRNSADDAVLESYLALPYVYGKFGSHGKAIKLYESAITEYERALEKIATFSDSIEDGSFLYRVNQRKYQPDMSWLLNIDAVHDVSADTEALPATYYLMELIASREFQEAVKNHIELDELEIRIADWRRTVRSLQSLVEERGNNFDSQMQQIDALLVSIDKRIDELMMKRIELGSVTSNPLLYASLGRVSLDRVSLDRVVGDPSEDLADSSISNVPAPGSSQHELDESIQEMQQRRDFIETGRSKAKDLQGYKLPLHTINKKLNELSERSGRLREQQAASIKSMAMTELDRRKKLLDSYLVTARYELAKNYDQLAAKDAAQ